MGRCRIENPRQGREAREVGDGMMNVLFVHSKKDSPFAHRPLSSQEDMQLGISYIASYLQRHGHRTGLVVLSRLNRNLVHRAVRAFRPQLICFTAVATEYPFIANVARQLKRHSPDIFLLAGGVHVSLNPESCLSDSFDALCIGEGEEPVLELTKQLQEGRIPSGIGNLWIKHGSGTEKNPPRPFLQDLDSLPFPDREMWQEWIRGPATHTSVLLGRGCPFNCTYCCNQALRKLAPGQYVRFRSPENIMQEVEEVVRRSPSVDELYLEVESIGLKMDWAVDLCAHLEQFNRQRREPVFFGTNLRLAPNARLEELFSAMKRANFRFLNIGVESGSERVRREILNRRYSNDDVIEAVRLARKHGLKVAFYNMIGLPGETIDDFQETVRINRLCQPDWHSAYIFFPYPGTVLHSLCREKGLLKHPLDTRNERYKPALDLPGFTRSQIQKASTWFSYYVYKGYLPLHRILYRVFVAKMLSSYHLARLYSLTDFGILKWLRGVLRPS